MATETSSAALPPEVEILQQLKSATASIPGIERFSGSATSFVRGEIPLEQAVTEMMTFFDGDLIGPSDERQRLIALAKQLNARYGTVSVMLLTFMACTQALSCAESCARGS